MKTRAAVYLGVLMLATCCCAKGLAQDTLLTVQGKSMVVKLLHVLEPEGVLQFRLPDTDSSVHQMHLTEIFLIKYGNGSREAYPEHLTLSDGAGMGLYRPGSLSKEQLYRKGIADARAHYNSLPTGLATGAISAVNPLVGLGTAAVIGAPKGNITKVPDPELWKDPVYKFAYLTEAKRMRKSAAFIGFGLGSLLPLLIFL